MKGERTKVKKTSVAITYTIKHEGRLEEVSTCIYFYCKSTVLTGGKSNYNLLALFYHI